MQIINFRALGSADEGVEGIDPLDQQILETQKEIADLLQITESYTGRRKEYKNKCKEKMQILQELYNKLTKLKKNKESFEEEYQEYNEFFDSMGFGEWDGGFWWFSSYEDFFHNFDQEQQNYRDEHYTRVDKDEIQGELVDALGELSSKDIWRKISKILHPDILQHNADISSNKESLAFFTDLFNTLLGYYEKDDKRAIIKALQEAGIKFMDDKFQLPDSLKIKAGVKNIYKQKILNELLQRVQLIKSTSIYAFYVSYKNGDSQIRLNQLDDEIQELEDLLASYEQVEIVHE